MDRPAARLLGLLALALLVSALPIACDSSGPQVKDEPPEDPLPTSPGVSLRLSAEADRPGVQLSWEGSKLKEASRFRVYRSAEADFDTTGRAIASTTERELLDTTAAPSETFYYRASALDGDSTLALSGEKKAVAPPGVTSQLGGKGEFYRSALQWQPAEGASEGYHVYRSKEPFSSAGEATRLTGVPAGGLQFTDSTALDGVTYHYRVAAVGVEGTEGELSPEAEVTPTFEGDPLAGRKVFQENCATCHASPQASGLQAFSFPDTTIHRRDLKHVSEEESFDVIAFLRGGDAHRREDVRLGDPEVPPFQPGGRVLSSDKRFGIELFGEDEWPEDLTRQELLGKRPTEQPVPFPMPEWSSERHKFDWIADRNVPDAIRQAPAVARALGRYRSSPTDENLVRLWREIQEAKPRGNTPIRRYATRDISTSAEFANLLERTRWIANLIGTHALRSKDEIRAMKRLVEMSPDESRPRIRETAIKEIWTVGELFRIARFAEIPERIHHETGPGLPKSYGLSDIDASDSRFIKSKEVQLRWEYLSWMFAHESRSLKFEYFTEHFGHGPSWERVGAYVLAYTTADMPTEHSSAPYKAIRNFGTTTPQHWQPELLPFVYGNILHYIDEGNQLYENCASYERYIDRVRGAADYVLNENSYFGGENREEIETKRDKIIDYIKAQREKHQGGCG